MLLLLDILNHTSKLNEFSAKIIQQKLIFSDVYPFNLVKGIDLVALWQNYVAWKEY